ncbi:hypothetical protein FA10DRAFT_266735 [Acaromyces ingoldii]|uniref:GST C-terminal domain-containing protein n=1 Tax=Acaromyces ingoldii TaxID=215250 RepID=A0A316YLV8_9BASI|nr:hypothetical protein FA10DRAFT_266735 [Acaromyces ingoldii]PWN90239.1 hypothetical protein FA10DRAFT_266735 [Acaromyces ingoldii]
MSASQEYKDGSMSFAGKDGHYRRQVSSFRDAISGEADAKFKPERNRYHLIAALACPWAHRALIVRSLKGIDKVPDLLPVTIVDSLLGSEGWSFVPYDEPAGLGVPGTGNHIPGHENKKRIREFYLAAEPNYSQRCTVPVIWDNKLNTIVNNESSEVIRMLNHCFDDFVEPQFKSIDLYPQELRAEIDGINEWVYNTVNNGVYKSGFATTQQAYEENVKPLFESLDRLEKILSDGREFLLAGKLTEADVRLFTTIVRFDPVYVGHFKCNFDTIRRGYPQLHRWLRNLYWKGPNSAAFKDTTDFESIKAHYYQSHPQINPTRVVPKGPIPSILPLD